MTPPTPEEVSQHLNKQGIASYMVLYQELWDTGTVERGKKIFLVVRHRWQNLFWPTVEVVSGIDFRTDSVFGLLAAGGWSVKIRSIPVGRFFRWLESQYKQESLRLRPLPPVTLRPKD